MAGLVFVYSITRIFCLTALLASGVTCIFYANEIFNLSQDNSKYTCHPSWRAISSHLFPSQYVQLVFIEPFFWEKHFTGLLERKEMISPSFSKCL